MSYPDKEREKTKLSKLITYNKVKKVIWNLEKQEPFALYTKKNLIIAEVLGIIIKWLLLFMQFAYWFCHARKIKQEINISMIIEKFIPVSFRD